MRAVARIIFTSLFLDQITKYLVQKSIAMYKVIPVAGIIIISFFGLDQITKYLVQKFITMYKVIPVIGDYVKLRHIKNSGGAFGLFANIPHKDIFFLIVSIIALLILFYLFIKCPRDNHLMQWAIALIGGGALGNLYDRILYKEVIDFLDVGFGVHRWPTFNVADIAITIGVIFVLIETIISSSEPESEDIVDTVQSSQSENVSL